MGFFADKQKYQLKIGIFVVFILEGFSPKFSLGETVSHLLVALLVLAIAVAAFKLPKVGGWLFVTFAILIFIFLNPGWNSVIIGGINLITGILFLVEGFWGQKFTGKKVVLPLLILIIILAVFGGYFWHNRKTVKVESKQQEAATTRPAEKNINEKTDFYSITAKIPVESLDKGSVMEQFVTHLVEQKKEEWKTGGQVYNDEKDVEKQFPDRPKMVYTLDIAYQKFESQKMGSVSYVFTAGEYTGGANGNETVQTFSFNKSGQVGIESILNLSGSFGTSGGQTVYNDLALSKMLFNQALLNKDEFPDEKMLKDGLGLSYLKADGVTLNHAKCHCDGFLYASNLQNFAMTNEGITFYFNKYAITSGAAGIAEIALNWNSLQPYLVSEVSAQQLPAGYSLKNYTVAKVLDAACKVDSECQTPVEYLIRSNCPYTSLCLKEKCAVVCPGHEGN